MNPIFTIYIPRYIIQYFPAIVSQFTLLKIEEKRVSTAKRIERGL